jgi:hypothetical protein
MQRDDPDVVVKLKTESRGFMKPNVVRGIAFAVMLRRFSPGKEHKKRFWL